MTGRSDKPGRFFSIFRIAVFLLVIVTGFLGYRTCDSHHAATGRYSAQLVKVVDGDTIRVSAGDEDIRIRLIGIDAEELGNASSFRCALAAAEILEDAARIEIEPEPSRPTDKYGRTLGWVWVTDREGGEILLQEELVRAGLCELYRDARGSKYYARLELAWRMR